MINDPKVEKWVRNKDQKKLLWWFTIVKKLSRKDASETIDKVRDEMRKEGKL